MKQLVIMPGGFHPFHPGHLALYQSAQQAFPGADVKVAATNDTSSRPFPFRLKEKIAQLAGVPAGDFYQVKSPFRADEITKNYDPATTQLIFVRSKKDSAIPPIPGGIKRDGNPAYLQPISRNMKPMTQHAYMAYLPVKKFGPGMTGASDIRAEWPTLDQDGKIDRVMSLYPRAEENPKLAKTVVDMWDEAMGTQAQDVTESHRIVTELRNTMYQYIKSIAPKWPDYVVRDWLYKGRGKNKNYNINSRDIKNEVIEMISDAGLTPDTQWQLVPDMKFTMDMFDPMTKQRLIGRAGGHSDLGMGIPRDKERHATQAALAQQQGGIRKEPVILIKTAKGYELLEGWHRTIQHFAKYPEGYTGPAWVAVAQGMNEATGDERFDNLMRRIRQEPIIPDAQMPPTDVKDLYHWAVKHHKPYHKIFAHWANREGYKSVAPALQKAGNLDSDALDYWTPDVWKLWYGPDAEMPRHWSKERVPDELRDYLEGVFDAYENIWQDWPTEYRQIGQQGVDEEVTRQMSQGGLRASYQSKYNQPISEDYLDEARS